jgi:hypothetical protein
VWNLVGSCSCGELAVPCFSSWVGFRYFYGVLTCDYWCPITVFIYVSLTMKQIFGALIISCCILV